MHKVNIAQTDWIQGRNTEILWSMSQVNGLNQKCVIKKSLKLLVCHVLI